MSYIAKNTINTYQMQYIDVRLIMKKISCNKINSFYADLPITSNSQISYRKVTFPPYYPLTVDIFYFLLTYHVDIWF